MAGARNRNNITTRSQAPDTRRLPIPGLERLLKLARARPYATAAGSGLTLAALSLAALAFWPHTPHRYEPPTTARQHSSYTTCLLTDSQGVTSAAAAPVWSAMQTASLATTEQARYLAVNGADTLSNTEVYLNALAQRACNVIVATGTQPAAAARARAAAFPSIHFIIIGPDTPNTSNLESMEANQVASSLEASYPKSNS